MPSFSASRPPVCRVIVGDDHELCAELRNIARHEAMDERDREDAILTLQCFQPINIGAHRLAARRIHADHATIESRNYRLDFTFEGPQGKVDHVLAALVEIRMRKLEKGGQNIGVLDALAGEMAVRIQLRGDEDIGADDAAGPLKQITLAIVITLRHHGTMQTKDDAINRQCRL